MARCLCLLSLANHDNSAMSDAFVANPPGGMKLPKAYRPRLKLQMRVKLDVSGWQSTAPPLCSRPCEPSWRRCDARVARQLRKGVPFLEFPSLRFPALPFWLYQPQLNADAAPSNQSCQCPRPLSACFVAAPRSHINPSFPADVVHRPNCLIPLTSHIFKY